MKSVDLLLLENVDNLGIVGDVVKVKAGYARNYLLPMAKATTPTQGAIARLAEKREQVAQQLLHLRGQQEQLIKRLEEFELTIQRTANEDGVLYGGVSQRDITDALREEGIDIDDRTVRVGDQIKRLDTYKVRIELAKDLQTEIKLWVVSDKSLEDLANDPQQQPVQADMDDQEE